MPTLGVQAVGKSVLELSIHVGVIPESPMIGFWHPSKKEGWELMSVFDEKYRVVGIEGNRLLLRGIHSGDMLTILNSEPEIPLSREDYPIGKLIALSDPAGALRN